MNKNYFYITVAEEHQTLFYGAATLTDDFDAAKQFQYREDAEQVIIDNRLQNASVHELCGI